MLKHQGQGWNERSGFSLLVTAPAVRTPVWAVTLNCIYKSSLSRDVLNCVPVNLSMQMCTYPWIILKYTYICMYVRDTQKLAWFQCMNSDAHMWLWKVNIASAHELSTLDQQPDWGKRKKNTGGAFHFPFPSTPQRWGWNEWDWMCTSSTSVCSKTQGSAPPT